MPMRKFFKRSFIIIIAFSIVFAAETSFLFAASAAPEKERGWHLIWHDEFDGDALDTSKWRAEDAALVKNNEMQYYTPEDVYVHDGLLTLRSQKRWKADREYTSGLVETKGKFAFQYGRVEIRAKMPKGRGLWPAHWMLPASGKWPPEIDIVEIIGHQPNVMYMNVHWGTWPDKKNKGKMFIGPDFSEDFHAFALEWDKDALVWFVDGKELFRENEYVPKEPFYIILNTAVGGGWPGKPNSKTKFPQHHDIDYVRVYAREITGTYFLTASAVNGKIEIAPLKPRYNRGEKISVFARAGIGFIFDGWEGDLTGKDNPAEITMNKHTDIEAKFVKDPNAPGLISRGKKVTASSQEAGNLLPEYIVDGDYNTRWSSKFSDPQQITIDLGKTYQITDIRLRWEVAFAKEYNINVSCDGTQWTTIYSTKNGTGNTEEISGLNTKAGYVAIEGIKRAREFGYSLWEVEIYGRPLSALAETRNN